MSQTFIIPGTLPALNEVIAASKQHWSQYAREKKNSTDKVYWLAKELEKISGKVFITCTWYCPSRRKDPDNIAAGGRKCILDGLVKAGILRSDGWKHVAGLTDIFALDKNNPRIEVFLEEHAMEEKDD